MKSALTHVLFLLFAIGVFGDAEKAETVSVIEGESVTLHTGVTEIQSSDVIEWRLNGNRIAKISGGSIITEGPSKDRLKLDKLTGDLKITNIKTSDSGEYKLKISSTRGSPPEKTFNVSVSADTVRPLSMLVGDSVTLNTYLHLTQTQIYDVVQWRFEHLNSTIAEINRTAGIFSTYDVSDGRFGDRLKLECLTGSLTIKNIRTEHSGVYEVDIRTSSGYTMHKSFNMTVSGEMKSALSVKKGESVTLNSGLTEIQGDDRMLWMFEDTVIAERFTDDLDERFRGRLKLDKKNGSLTITNTRTEDSGIYELKISSSRRTIHKRFTVTVSDPGLSTGAIAGIVCAVLLAFAAAAAGVIYYRRKISELKTWILYILRILTVMEGEPVTLKPKGEHIAQNPDGVHKDDKLLWMFRGSCIAERKSAADRFTVRDDVLDGRFKDRLKLDHQTGSLTITNTRPTDTGEYELLIIRSEEISIKRFRVSVFDKTKEIKQVSVKKGGSVTLETDVTDIQKDDQIQWKFGYTPLAVVTGWIKEISPFSDEIFKGRLELDRQTGSLTIKKIRPTDAGIYLLEKRRGKIETILFRVSLSESTDNRNNPKAESVRKDNPENVPLTNVHVP